MSKRLRRSQPHIPGEIVQAILSFFSGDETELLQFRLVSRLWNLSFESTTRHPMVFALVLRIRLIRSLLSVPVSGLPFCERCIGLNTRSRETFLSCTSCLSHFRRNVDRVISPQLHQRFNRDAYSSFRDAVLDDIDESSPDGSAVAFVQKLLEDFTIETAYTDINRTYGELRKVISLRLDDFQIVLTYRNEMDDGEGIYMDFGDAVYDIGVKFLDLRPPESRIHHVAEIVTALCERWGIQDLSNDERGEVRRALQKGIFESELKENLDLKVEIPHEAEQQQEVAEDIVLEAGSPEM